MTTLHLIRHAAAAIDETHYADHRTMGLSALGRRQAATAAARLLKLAGRLELIITSSFPRARETADHIAELTGIVLQVDDRLCERTFPRLYGLAYSEISAAHGEDVVARLLTNSDLLDGWGAPSLETCSIGVRTLVADLAAHLARNICVVAHGGPLGWMLSHLLGIEEPSAGRLFRFDHAGYSRVVIDDNCGTLLTIDVLNHPLAEFPW